MQFLIGLVAVLLLVSLVAQIEQARAATVVSGYVDQRFFDHYLTVTGDSLANDIVVERDAADEAFLVSDSRPIEISDEPENRCVHLAPTQVECRLRSIQLQAEIDSHAGADTVTIDHTMAGFVVRGGGGRDAVTGGDGDDAIHGGSGRDSLTGGNGDDAIAGNKGKDVERGRIGSDRVGVLYRAGTVEEGDPGRDKVLGGRGDDTVRADDRKRDRRIDCGRGTDVGVKDAGLDPRPRACEVIRHLP